jgi:hypothetical protein
VKRLLCGALVLVLFGCATNSGASSGNSSANSGNSSGQSGASSQNSSDSSRSSSGSSNTDANQKAKDSSANSTRGTTEDSSRSNSSNNGNAGPILTTAGLVLVVAGLGVLIWAVALRKRAPEVEEIPSPESAPGAPAPSPAAPGGPSPEHVEAARVFVAANRAQLAQDLALGAGRSIDDLAAAAGIRQENLGRFGRLLRAHRAELLELARAEPLPGADAVRLLQRVGELSGQDERLRRDGEALLLLHAPALAQ